MTENSRVLLVADYGANDLAFSEVKQRLFELAKAAGKHITVDTISTTRPFDSEETARIVRYYADSGKYDYIYHNTAPRKDKKEARTAGDGEPLAATIYRNTAGKEVSIIGVFAADQSKVNTFAYLDATQCRHPRQQDKQGIFKVDCATDTSQFRSRDVFPSPVIDMVAGKLKTLEALAPEHLSLPAGTHVPAMCPFARHGIGSNSITIIAPPHADLVQQFDVLHHQYPSVHLDYLKLKAHGSTAEAIEAGFAAAQLACNASTALPRTIFALTKHGVATDKHRWLIAELDNGSRVITDNPAALSFVKSRALHIWQLKQLDFYSIADQYALPQQTIDDSTPHVQPFVSAVPAIASTTIAYVDGYGNCKLAGTFNALKKELLPPNADPSHVHFLTVGGSKGASLQASIKPVGAKGSSFSVPEGQLAFSSGSSGWAKDGQPVDYHTELFLRGGSAAKTLGGLQAGDKPTLKYTRSIPAQEAARSIA